MGQPRCKGDLVARDTASSGASPHSTPEAQTYLLQSLQFILEEEVFLLHNVSLQFNFGKLGLQRRHQSGRLRKVSDTVIGQGSFTGPKEDNLEGPVRAQPNGIALTALIFLELTKLSPKSLQVQRGSAA